MQRSAGGVATIPQIEIVSVAYRFGVAGARDAVDAHLARCPHLSGHPASAAWGYEQGRTLPIGFALVPPDAPEGWAGDPRVLAADGAGWTRSVRAHRFALAEIYGRGLEWDPESWLVKRPWVPTLDGERLSNVWATRVSTMGGPVRATVTFYGSGPNSLVPFDRLGTRVMLLEVDERVGPERMVPVRASWGCDGAIDVEFVDPSIVLDWQTA